jgi:hypothetical protein
VTQELLQDLRQAAEPAPPAGFRPGVVFAGRMPSEIVTPPMPQMDSPEEWEAAVLGMGVTLPEGYVLVLVEALLASSHNPASWKRDEDDKGAPHTAYTAPNTTHRWRYKFKVVLKSARSDEDIAVLMREAKKAGRARPPLAVKQFGSTMVINLSDFQVGKVDILGGTPELLGRSEAALAQVLSWIKTSRPDEIVLVDPGDSTEQFESAPNAARTNDLQQTEQIRVWRLILWRWIEAIAPLTHDFKVIGVPSNHCRVRQGKNAQGHALDDWGIEVISQVSDIAAVNPIAYGHVRFIIPATDNEEWVLFTLVSGKTIGVAHGHQRSKPEQLVEYAKTNARAGIGQADIVICGHFHHLRVIAFGDGQFLFVCPTMDSGSSWFQSSGEKSSPGVLTFMVDEDGWRDMRVAWS